MVFSADVTWQSEILQKNDHFVCFVIQSQNFALHYNTLDEIYFLT